MNKFPNIKLDEFLIRYNIKREDYAKSGINWNDLLTIHADYLERQPLFESFAFFFYDALRRIENVHSLKFRTKEPEHLIEKIIRKRIENSKRIINLANYRREITDLIGVRVIHLFKDEWIAIHEFILKTFEQVKEPTLNIRSGDENDIIETFKSANWHVVEHPAGYRSIHYLVSASLGKEPAMAEIQVRTIFEEGWSEIDHTIRYPYDVGNEIFSQFLFLFNRLAGSADEMGTFIKWLKRELQDRERNVSIQFKEKDELIQDLRKTIGKLKIDKDEKQTLSTSLDALLRAEKTTAFQDTKNQKHLATALSKMRFSSAGLGPLAPEKLESLRKKMGRAKFIPPTLS